MTIVSKTERPPAYAQLMSIVHARPEPAAGVQHMLHADVSEELGGSDSAPSPHDLFDASLAACKTLTAHWYAKRAGIPLEAVDVRIERDESKEREGVYKLDVHLTYHGPLSEAQRSKLHAAVARCPVHKLMTTTEVVIETAPL